MTRKKSQEYKEYPLFNEHYRKCPTARYVGGGSRYLCECRVPSQCEGVKAVAQEEKKGES